MNIENMDKVLPLKELMGDIRQSRLDLGLGEWSDLGRVARRFPKHSGLLLHQTREIFEKMLNEIEENARKEIESL